MAATAAIAPFSFIRTSAGASVPLHRFLRETARTAKIAGLAVAVVRGDEVVFSAGAGWANIERQVRADADTVFMLASVSKTVTCAGVMTLVERGDIDLDADIDRYLPFEVRIPAFPKDRVTMRMLLTHTSSIRDRYSVWGTPYSDPTLYAHGDSPISLGDFMRSYLSPAGSEYRHAHNFYERRPGSGYAYSNLGVALAGYAAEVASGQDFNELCKHRILLPLGMTQSGFRRSDITTGNLAMPYRLDPATGGYDPYFQFGYPDYPDGALRTSAKHLARWLGAFMRFGSFQGVRVLERDTIREIRRNQIPNIVGWHQGLVWYGSDDAHRRLGHTGGDYGISTRMFFRPDQHMGVVTLANTSVGGSRWYALRDVERRMFEEFS